MKTNQRQKLQTRDGPASLTHIEVPLTLKAADDEGTIAGYGSVFNVEDSFADVVAPGAFGESLARHKAEGTMPAMLWQHDTRQPIGVWDGMKEDNIGLFVEGRLALETDRGNETHILLKMGAFNGLSIGFMPVKWEWDEEEKKRTVTEIDLWEVSLVTFPANGQARVNDVRMEQIVDERSAEKYLRDSGFSRAASVALVSRMKAIGAQRESEAELADVGAGAARLLQSLNS